MIKRSFSLLRSEKVLSFWFEGLKDENSFSQDLLKKWFYSDPELNKFIETEFLQDLNSASAGKYDDWQKNPRSTLALIILLDQFSRNLYQDSNKAYANDSKCLEIALIGIEKKFDLAVWPVQRLFYYLPLEHSEDILMQNLCIQKFTELNQNLDQNLKEFGEAVLHYAKLHHQVIDQFGRYPHRNKILNRVSTKAEEEYLANNPTGFS